MNIVERKGEIPDPDFEDLAPRPEPADSSKREN